MCLKTSFLSKHLRKDLVWSLLRFLRRVSAAWLGMHLSGAAGAAPHKSAQWFTAGRGKLVKSQIRARLGQPRLSVFTDTPRSCSPDRGNPFQATKTLSLPLGPGVLTTEAMAAAAWTSSQQGGRAQGGLLLSVGHHSGPSHRPCEPPPCQPPQAMALILKRYRFPLWRSPEV